MGLCRITVTILVAGLAILALKYVKPIFDIPEKPNLGEKWWKVSKPSTVDTSIKPFKIQISDEILRDLKVRLDQTLPFQKALNGVSQHYGMNDKLLNNIITFWKTKYNWREREKFLNKYPQFKTNIQGLDIHYIHVKPTKTQGVKVLPLLLLHGWPGSVREFYSIIPLLTTPRQNQKFVFELIIPSLPGYGFSEAAELPGLSANEIAVIMKNLMIRVGFEKFYIQGGDWGAAIVSTMAMLFPENIIGVHSNMCSASTPIANLKLILGSIYPPLVATKEEEPLLYPLSKIFSKILLESGYLHIQATKPDTVGVALRESPAGLAAYILEKFTSWTNLEWKKLDDGGLTKRFSLEDLLDNVMIYWVTRSITTSQRLYAETFSSNVFRYDSIPVHVPSACARFANELMITPEANLRSKYTNLLQVTLYYDGGHFAAFEVPQVLANDVIQFVEKVENLL